MLFFEKTSKLSNFLLTLFVLFLILAFIFLASSQFTEVLSYNFTNDLRGTVWMIVCFGISISSFIAGVALKVMIKEANDEMKRLEERMRKNQL